MKTTSRPDRVIEFVKTARTKILDGYSYRIYPFGENGVFMDCELLTEIKEKLIDLWRVIDDGKPLRVGAIMPGGAQWGLLLASEFSTSIFYIRNGSQESAKGAIEWSLSSVLEDPEYASQIIDGTDIVIVDDFISSGSTLIEAIRTLRASKVKVSGIISVGGTAHGIEKVFSDTGIRPLVVYALPPS